MLLQPKKTTLLLSQFKAVCSDKSWTTHLHSSSHMEPKRFFLPLVVVLISSRGRTAVASGGVAMARRWRQAFLSSRDKTLRVSPSGGGAPGGDFGPEHSLLEQVPAGDLVRAGKEALGPRFASLRGAGLRSVGRSSKMKVEPVEEDGRSGGFGRLVGGSFLDYWMAIREASGLDLDGWSGKGSDGNGDGHSHHLIRLADKHGGLDVRT